MPKENINNHTGTTANNDHNHCYRHDEPASGDHICILYETLAEIVESVIPFISSGIELYHKCIYITDSDGHDKVLTALTTGGLNTATCLKAQQLLIRSSADFYTPAGCFEPDNVIGCLLKEAEKAAREGYGCLRVTGDMSWALRDINSTGRLLEYESRLNALPDSSPLITLCQYDITRFDGETLKGVLRTHPKLIWQGEVLENHYYIPTADFLSDKRSQYEVKHWLNNLKVWKNRQLALEESEARYRTIFESTGTATCILNKHWQITLANSHWEKITGYPIHEIEGIKHLQDFLHPEDIEEFNSKFQPANYKAGIAPDNHEVRIITKKGDLRNVLLTTKKIHSSDNRIVSAIDISDRKRAEEELMQSNHRYHALFDLAPVAIYEVDFSETKKYFEILRNQGIRNFQEYFTQNIDELLKCHRLAVNLGSNKTLLDIWEAENVEQINRAIYSAFTQKTASYVSHADTMVKLANGFTSFSKDETLFTIRGNIRYIRTHVNVAPGFEKTLARVYICFYDTTELVKMSRELIRYKENLEELVKERTRKLALETEKSLRLNRKVTELYEREMQLREQLESRMKERAELTRFLVHELKTPLTPMLGSTDILLEQVRGTKLERLATNIHRGTISLNNRVNDLLDLARGEMGLLQLNCKYIDISSLVKDTIMFMAIEFERRNQSIVFNPPAEFPQVWADSERIRQVLLNLLENASKFTLPRSTVTVKLEKDDKKVVVQVEDNGFGIKRDRQQTLFSDYSRHAKPDDPAANMGIGLPLCKMLVELHGGNLWLSSEEGKGSKFFFSLPVQPPEGQRGQLS